MRQPTSSPLVEKDDDNSFIPAGRQHAPTPRTDGRTSAGLTSAENVAFAFACEHLNGTQPPAEYAVSEEETAAMMAAGDDSHATAETKRAFLELYRASHPLPTSYSALPPGDPSLYVAPPIAAAPIVITPIPSGATPEGPTFIRTMPDPDAASPYSKPTVRVLTGPYIPPVAPPVTPPASTLTTVLDTATEIAAFAEAHPQAVTALLSVLRSLGGLFTHKAA